MAIQRVCVFCGSSPGDGPGYLAAAEALGDELLARGFGLVYGGAGVGLMGRIADTVVAGGGEVVGVMPSALVDREVAHPGLSDLRVVDSMHERKALMADLADAFIALPGGLGTVEELLEALTWAQLGMHPNRAASSTSRATSIPSWPSSTSRSTGGSSIRTIGRCCSIRTIREHSSTFSRRLRDRRSTRPRGSSMSTG